MHAIQRVLGIKDAAGAVEAARRTVDDFLVFHRNLEVISPFGKSVMYAAYHSPGYMDAVFAEFVVSIRAGDMEKTEGLSSVLLSKRTSWKASRAQKLEAWSAFTACHPEGMFTLLTPSWFDVDRRCDADPGATLGALSLSPLIPCGHETAFPQHVHDEALTLTTKADYYHAMGHRMYTLAARIQQQPDNEQHGVLSACARGDCDAFFDAFVTQWYRTGKGRKPTAHAYLCLHAEASVDRYFDRFNRTHSWTVHWLLFQYSVQPVELQTRVLIRLYQIGANLCDISAASPASILGAREWFRNQLVSPLASVLDVAQIPEDVAALVITPFEHASPVCRCHATPRS